MSGFRTEQEGFWAGGFGDDYSDRVRGDALLAANLSLFARVLRRTEAVGSLLELGANIGLNLRAIRQLRPDAELAAVEINEQAVTQLNRLGNVEIHHQSVLDFVPTRCFDLVLTKGLLIHMAPDSLPRVYDLLRAATSRYVCLVEYYNPSPVSIPYRGHDDRLFKRDFAGELRQRHPDLRLLDYGFVYHGDPCFPQDDVTWFLLEVSGEKPSASRPTTD